MSEQRSFEVEQLFSLLQDCRSIKIGFNKICLWFTDFNVIKLADMDEKKIRRQFDAAVKVIQGLPKDGSFKPSHELMLKFYAFYKQATVGKCTASKPGFWDVVGKAKWEAWSSLGSMSADEAMKGYVHELTQIVEMMPQTDEVSHLVKELDEFHEMIRVPPEEILSAETDIPVDEPTLSNGHIPNNSQSANNNGLTSQSHETIPTHNSDGAAPDLLSVEQSEASRSGSISENSGESDTDSEDYMDSSDVVSTASNFSNPTKEKTVDLLAGCPAPLTEHTNHVIAQQVPASTYTHSAHSSLHQPSTRPKKVEAHRPAAVSFLLPEESATTEEVTSPTRTDVVNEKLRMALLNMQQEMSSLEKRLSLVEQITVNERRKQLGKVHRFMKWWPFPELHPRTVVLLLVWPIFVSWFMTYLARRRRRR